MTVKRRYSPAMRGITVAAAAAALIMTGTGTAQAWHVPWGHHRVHAAATAPALGKCVADPDHIGGSTCEISTFALHDGPTQVGVQVGIGNYNAYPVRIDTLYKDPASADGFTSVATRVPAHSQKSFVVPWGTASSLWFQFHDSFGRDLGSAIVDKP